MEEQEFIESTSNERTVNNAVRHQYRVLTEAEKATVTEIKDIGDLFIRILEELGRIQDGSVGTTSHREYALAKTKMEEAVMWAVKGVTK